MAETTGPQGPPDGASELREASEEIAALLVRRGVVAEDRLAYARRIHGKLTTPKSLLDVLRELDLVSDSQIRQALAAEPTSIRLGTLLIELGYLHPRDLQKALVLAERAKGGKRLGAILLEKRLIRPEQLCEALALRLGVPHREPDPRAIDPALLRKAPPRWYAEHRFVPLDEAEDGTVAVAFVDPQDDRARRAATQVFGTVAPAIATPASVEMVVTFLERDRKRRAEGDESTVKALVEELFSEAVEKGASDIHIEPMGDRLRIRLRLDGVLVPLKDLPLDLATSLSTRIKILAEADITERRRHQDGRILFEDPNSGDTLDMRASFYVTIHGEKIVLRLLNQKGELRSIEDSGMAPKMLERFRQDALDIPSGVVIVTGPTGSGKTTTLYGAVDHLNHDDRSIITAEDPVEYVVDGISQCSINPKIGVTFEETLRHIVRQDPDVIVLGEIRDHFSAATAIQAALTGHKVLTTFHTEDSIGGLLRLLNMNIEAFLISSTVLCVVAQRLLRRVCSQCAEPVKPTSAELRRLGVAAADAEGAGFQAGRGCALCHFTGYRGRVGVFELLVLSEEVKDAILARKTSYEIRRISTETSGLVTLMEDGIVKAADGVTTLAEVARALPRLGRPRPIPELRRLLGS